MMESSETNNPIKKSKVLSIKKIKSLNNLQFVTPRVYNPSELKMLLFLCLIDQFRNGHKVIIQRNEKEIEDKRKQTINEFSRSRATLKIEPIKKEILMLGKTAKIMDRMYQNIRSYFASNYRINPVRKSMNCYLMSSLTFIDEQNTSSKKLLQKNQEEDSICESSKKLSTKVSEYGRENYSKNYNTLHPIKHKRYASYGSSLGHKSCDSKEEQSQERKVQIFLARKKSEINFFLKMHMECTSYSAEIKALLELMQVFVKNLNRANHFLKDIQENLQKGERIIVYLHELIRLFHSILEIMRFISTFHQSLKIPKEKEEECIMRINYFSPVLKGYFEMSREIFMLIKVFSLSPFFPKVASRHRTDCRKLISLFVESRYVLKHLEKEIQNFDFLKKEEKKMAKWQKAYMQKFVSKNFM